jgi:hypothetical protein
MKKLKKKKTTRKRTTKASISVVIDKKLDALSNTILFKKKLEKANRILSEGGLPA